MPNKRKLFFFILTLFLSSVSIGQSYNPYYGGIVTQCNNDTLQNNLNEFVGFGVKEIGTTALNDTKNWILNKYAEYGYTDVLEDAFMYSGSSTSNIVVTKTGTLYPNTYLIIDAHYDTKNGVGANDNGSGTILLLELARLLKDVQTEYSIKFIHFTVEEVGLVGSQHYVDNTVIPQNQDILLVFNIDQVGGISGMTNNTIVCEEDQDSPFTNNAASSAATVTLSNCMELYSNLITEISYAYASDYMPFEENDEIITGLYEKNESPYTHTSNDVIANMDLNYVYEVTQGALGAALEFAIAFQDETALLEINELDCRLYPNPSNGTFFIQAPDLEDKKFTVEVTDALGTVLFSEEKEGTKDLFSLDLNEISNGTYILSIRSQNQRKILKLIIN